MLTLSFNGPSNTFALEHHLWNCVVRPKTIATLGVKEDGLHVHFKVEESKPLTTALIQQEPMLMVCQDSAVELFLAFPDDEHDQNFAPMLEQCLYLNIEINSKGICYAKHGHSRKNRIAFTKEQIESLQIKAYGNDNTWCIDLVVPRNLIKELAQYDAFSPEHTFALNLYKISESKDIEHYIAFNKVDVPTPNFHLPQYFALCQIA